MALDNPPFRSAEEIAVEFNTAVPSGEFRYFLGTKGITNLAEMRAFNTALSILQVGLEDVTGLEYATNLTNLSVRTNGISTFPDISQLTTLASINISVNNISSSIGRLVGMTGLAGFVANNCLFEQAELEQMIDDLYTNRVAIGALSCTIDLRNNPGSSSAASSMSTEIAALVSAGCSVAI